MILNNFEGSLCFILRNIWTNLRVPKCFIFGRIWFERIFECFVFGRVLKNPEGSWCIIFGEIFDIEIPSCSVFNRIWKNLGLPCVLFGKEFEDILRFPVFYFWKNLKESWYFIPRVLFLMECESILMSSGVEFLKEF